LQPPLQVGLAGLGAIGREVARRLAAGIPGLRLAAVAVRDPQKARGDPEKLGGAAVVSLATLAETCDVVVEGLPPQLFRAAALPAIERG